MPVIDLEQGSQSWLDYRKDKIMATDTPILLGSNPWKTPYTLWEEKLGLKQPEKTNDAMRRGHELEPKARELACGITEINFEPAVVESTKYPWLAASLDGIGIGYNQYILEIKCPKPSTHDDALEGRIPEYYIDQIQHQLLVSEAEICYYFSYRPERTDKPYAIVEIYKDLNKHEQIIEKGQEFYNRMCTMNPPKEWRFKEKPRM